MTDMLPLALTGIAAIAVCMVAAWAVVTGIYRAIDPALDAAAWAWGKLPFAKNQ